jgi:hypothetical protein
LEDDLASTSLILLASTQTRYSQKRENMLTVGVKGAALQINQLPVAVLQSKHNFNLIFTS